MSEYQEEPVNDPLYSKKVIEMLTVANEYCLFIEKAEEIEKEKIFRFLQKLLPLLYLKASLLPDIKVSDESMAEHFVTEEQWEEIFNVLRNKFGKDDQYLFVDLQEKTNSDAIAASLAENLSDIYQDMKDFVILYQKPTRSSQENAVKDCRELFETRFGFRMVNALMAIHNLLYESADRMNYEDLDQG
jgi:hypothetical protein